MQRTFLEAIRHRRSCYALSGEEVVPAQQLINILDNALLNLPSAFNMQSTRLVLLLGRHHREFWDIVTETLRPMVPPDQFPRTSKKIATSFAAGYGTVLFYEDRAVVEQEKSANPTYAAQIDIYSEQGSAMQQFAIWTMLEDAGLGASLQHYNPLIDKAVAERWGIPDSWRLVAQMPFGKPIGWPSERVQRSPIEQRRLVFKE